MKLKFGPDGNLYVVDTGNDVVKEYNGTIGEFINNFVGFTPNNRFLDLTFGPDGNLYVDSQSNNDVKEYNGETGNLITTFVTPGSGNLNSANFLTFGPSVGAPPPTAVPEPSPTLGLFTFGVLLGGVGLKRQLQHKKQAKRGANSFQM